MEKNIANEGNQELNPEKIVVVGCLRDDVIPHIEEAVNKAIGNCELVRLDNKVISDYIEGKKKTANKVSISDFLADVDNRKGAEEKALLLWNMMTKNADIALADKRVFQKSEIVKATTLTHKTLGELLELLKMFGLVEYVEGVTYQFKFVFSPQVRLATLYADIIEAVGILNKSIACYKSGVDNAEHIAEKEREKSAIKENIEQLIKF